ncbi:DUF4265 domain-containing protein [Corallococcus interemptor]|uniref:DUF4265 domain-containing protein n=1 Tax=Corallococcus interemptor TaxID=2316720 RepID=UPI003D04E432
MVAGELRKVFFRLAQDEDGYPPAGTESLWAISSGNGRLVLDNTPFFVPNATLGDEIEVAEEDGQLWYRATARASDNSLIRIVVPKGADVAGIRSTLERLGCTSEFLPAYRLISVNVPGDASLKAVQQYLEDAISADEIVDYEAPILRQDWFHGEPR